MNLVFELITALAGGFIGAAIGANFSFVMVGFSLLAATGAAAAGAAGMSSVLFSYVAFGPFIGPHVAFVGGMAASASAARRGYTENGKDVVEPLAQLGRVDVLLVGAGFGGLGYLVSRGLALLPWLGSHTDVVALTVVTTGFIVRFALGDRSLLNPESFNPEGSRISPHEDAYWIRYQETPPQIAALGTFAGIFAAGVSLVLATSFPAIAELGNANTLPFAISAITICLLNMGYQVPVTHHVTITGGLAALTFYPMLAGATNISAAGWNPAAAVGALGVAAVFGVIAAFFAEGAARMFIARGSTHIDPPAFAIWFSNSLIALTALGVGLAVS